MKVVGLLSGGKDSCYNLLHCVQQGHEIVALATLAPAPGANDELDSYMYQTVGHDAVHLVAQAMQLPLYRQTIRGSAVNQGAEYGSRQSDRSRASGSSSKTVDAQTDETEDLFDLLMQVKQHHPDVEAVSIGAILSNYQRIRVEHVCFRETIQLQPLAFLWQRSQAQLLAEMTSPSAAPFTSILIKVAGIGLSQSDLGKTLQQMQPKLVKLHNLYGAHICGEGGEYETLTLDSPLFAHKIVIDETETVIHSDSAFGSVSYLKITKAHLEHKPDYQARSQVPIPKNLDAIGRQTLQAVSQSQPTVEKKEVQFPSMSKQLPEPSLFRKGRWCSIANITGQYAAELEVEVVSAFNTLSAKLAYVGLDLTHLVHINLYLANQSLFPAINAVYKTHFGVSPPTRACVGLRLQQSKSTSANPRFVMGAIAFDDRTASRRASSNRGSKEGQWAGEGERKALHVQSRSYWAPANIGPYSQAVVPARTDRIYIAGQIGLLPSDLSLPSLSLQQSLSIQHARRIYAAVMGDMASRSPTKGWIEGGICWVEAGCLNGARAAWLTQLPLEFDNDEAHVPEFANDQDGHDVQECWLGSQVRSVETLPPMLFASVAKGALPRGAAIEWQLTAHAGRVVTRDVVDHPDDSQTSARRHDVDDDDDEEDEVGMDAPPPTPSRVSFPLTLADGRPCRVVHQSLQSCKTRSSMGILSFSTPPTASEANDFLVAALQGIARTAYSIQLYYAPSDICNPMSLLTSLGAQIGDATFQGRCQYVPVDDLHILDLHDSKDDAPPLCQAALALVYHGT